MADSPSTLAFVARVARGSFGLQATYRSAAIGGIVANTAIAMLKASVLLAVVRANGDVNGVNGFDAPDLVTFAFVAMALDQPVAVFAGLELSRRIRSGDVVVDLYRPADLQLYWLGYEAGRAAFNVVVRLAPPIVIGGLLFDLRIPMAPATWIAFVVSVGAAMLLSFAFRFAVSLSTFWTLEANGVQGIANLLVVVLSGWLLPLALFPPAIAAVARNLPFASLAQLPIEVFLEKHSALGTLGIVGRQLAWAVAFLALGRLVMVRATRRVVVQGG